MGKSSSPPPAPDYASAATATAKGNLDATRAATAANRVNQFTPYGNLTYSQTPAYTTDQNAYDSAYKQWQSEGSQGTAPDVKNYQTYNPDAGWNATIDLSETGKKLLDAQNNSSLGLADLQSGALGRVRETMNSSMPGTTPITSDLGRGNEILNSLDTRGVQAIPTVDEAYQKKYQDAVYGQQAQYLNPQWSQEKDKFDAQMANQGLVPGGEAYNKAFQNFSNARQQAYSNAGMNAITGGLNAAQTNFGMGLNANQAGMQNALMQGNFTNQAQNQGFQQALARAQLANAASQQQLEQNAYMYNQPLNTLNAIRTGSQVQNPTFTNVPQQQTTAGPNYLGAAQAQYSGDLNGYSAQQGANSNFMGGLMNLGGSLGSAYLLSDRRLKSNIVQVRTHSLGFGIYDYDIFGQRVRGVMADEVEKIIPEAVITSESGYKMVDYGRL